MHSSTPASGLYRLFEDQVDRTPQAAAVEFQGESLSYHSLDRRARAFAHRLSERGVGPGDMVGVALPRSTLLTVGILGVMRSGAAYLPLDVSMPVERLRMMVVDSSASLVVAADASLAGHWPVSTLVIALDDDDESTDRDRMPADQRNTTNVKAVDSPTYVMYTSGSTGRPKGVVMSNNALVELVEWQVRRSSEFGPTRTLQFASSAFDVSFHEMFSTWLAGGTICMLPEGRQSDLEFIWSFILENHIERVFVPSIVLQMLGQFAAATSNRSKVKEIVTAGEQLRLTPELRQWIRAGVVIDNFYGATETQVATAYRLHSDDEVDLPPVGRQIPYAKAYLLDEGLGQVSNGSVGEIFVGGTGLAKGYIGRPGLTAERFMPDPYCGRPGQCMYRTGDLGRKLPDGEIQFVGRVDHQVKVRGHRVEPAEVESVLGQHPAVKDCAVLPIPNEDGVRLVAYVVVDR